MSDVRPDVVGGSAEAAPEPCLLCDVFDDSFRSVRDHIDGVRDRENEVGLDFPDFIDNDEPDVNNSTHTTQVKVPNLNV